MLLAHMQENCSAEFLSQHKLNGQPNQVLKRLTKDAMIVAYKAAIGESGESGESAPAPKAAAGGPTFKFEPPAAVAAAAAGVAGAAKQAFSFSPPSGSGATPPATSTAPPLTAAGVVSCAFGAGVTGGGWAGATCGVLIASAAPPAASAVGGAPPSCHVTCSHSATIPRSRRPTRRAARQTR